MDFALLFGIALAGGLASPIGGALSLLRHPTTLALSLSVGFASGLASTGDYNTGVGNGALYGVVLLLALMPAAAAGWARETA